MEDAEREGGGGEPRWRCAQGLGLQSSWIPTHHEALAKFYSSFLPQFPHPQNEDNTVNFLWANQRILWCVNK